MVVIVFGLPGSGKTYLASRLAERLQATYVSTDVIRKKLISVTTYSEQEKQSVYDRVLSEVSRALPKERIVVVDGTFHRKITRVMFAEYFNEICNTCFIEVRAEESLVSQRLAKKRKDSDADWEVYLKIKTEWQALPQAHLVLHSTNSNIEHLLYQSLEYLHYKDDNRTDK